MLHKLTSTLWSLGMLCLLPGLATAHPGSLDLNGGHYYGPSYHCHLPNCEIPDTFEFGNLRRDGVFTEYRDREKFFNEDDWSFEEDWDGDCQSTRQEMLVLTSRATVTYTNPRNCIVRTGEWLDEYTGEVFTVANQVDIDHVIPRMYAHTHGGDRWPADKKLQFSNDALNLIVTEKREKRRKADRGPNRYLPREGFQCEYVRLWNAVAEKYNLDLENRDKNEIKRVLKSCPEQ
jgi:hypothetical protein